MAALSPTSSATNRARFVSGLAYILLGPYHYGMNSSNLDRFASSLRWATSLQQSHSPSRCVTRCYVAHSHTRVDWAPPTALTLPPISSGLPSQMTQSA